MELVITAVAVGLTPFYMRFVWRRFARTPMGRSERMLAFGVGALMGVLWGTAFSQANLMLGSVVGAIAGVEVLEIFAYNSAGGPENQLRPPLRAARRAWRFSRAALSRLR